MDYSKLTQQELEAKTKQVHSITGLFSSIGTISAWVYVAKNGGGFWRYIGFGLMGGIAGAVLGMGLTLPMANKIEMEKAKLQVINE